MKTVNKNKKNRYDFGSFVEDNGSSIGAGVGMLGQAVGGGVGNAISSAGTGAAMGTAIAPGIGTLIGGAVGLIGGIFGNAKKKKAAKAQAAAQSLQFTNNYNAGFNEQLDTVNQNPYGNDLVFKMGGVVPANFINIEKGELQIDPATGKILREYDKVNPETGGLYEPHSKGKDTKHNFVSATPGTFIVTKDTGKDYKDAVDNNDKLHQASILQNIKNAKADEVKTQKFATGGGVGPLASLQNPKQPMFDGTLGMIMANGMNGGQLGQVGVPYIPPAQYKAPQMTTGLAPATIYPTSQAASNGGGLNSIGNFIGNYGPSLLNIGKGLFGKVEHQADVDQIRNPYANKILNSMPQDVSFEPQRQELLRQQNSQFNQIRNNTNGSPIARANMNNVFANTNQQLGKLKLDNVLANNQIAGQRANIYDSLGQQNMQAQSRAQQINLGIRESNIANQAAKDNLLTTGLSQAQQVWQNNKANSSKATMDKYKVDLLKQMFPNLKYYGDQFGSEALMKLIGK